MSKQIISDLLVMDEMSSRNMDISASPDIIGIEKRKAGGELKIGVAPAVFEKLIHSMATGDSKYVAITFVVNMHQFNQVKSELAAAESKDELVRELVECLKKVQVIARVDWQSDSPLTKEISMLISKASGQSNSFGKDTKQPEQ